MKKYSLAIYIIMILSAILLVSSFWIPFIGACDDLKDTIEDTPGKYVIYWDDDLSIDYEYMEYLSPQKYCAMVSKIHKIEYKFEHEMRKLDTSYSYSDNGAFIEYDLFNTIFILILIFSSLTALFVLLRNYIPSLIFSIITFVIILFTANYMITYYDNYEPSVGMFTYIISLLLIFICSICQIVLQKKIRNNKPATVVTNHQNQISEQKTTNNTWICPNCHNVSVGNFCNECGTRKPEIVSGKFCPNCGKNLCADANFCTNCGRKF